MLRALAVIALTAAVAGPGKAAPAEKRLTIFYTAETHGTLEPCGCTSDPLGDIARYATVVREARKQGNPVLLLDAGGLSYPESSTKKEKATDALCAKSVATELGKLGTFAAGLAETDIGVGAGAADVVPRRLAVNLGASP